MFLAQENAFERDKVVPGTPRAFLNPRRGQVAMDVAVFFSFDPQAAGPNAAGRLRVEIASQAAEEFPDAVLLRAEVLETRFIYDDPMDPLNGRLDEVVADWIVVHMVPSFIMLPAEFFEDLEAAKLAKLRHIPALQDRFSLDELVRNGIPRSPMPSPDPRWGALTAEHQARWATERLAAIQAAFPKQTELEQARLKIPNLGPG